MSDLGPIVFGQPDELVFLGKDLHEGRNYSETTANKIDEQVSKILLKAQKTAEEILTAHADKFELISKTLLEKETLNQKEFADLMGAPDPDTLQKDWPTGTPAPASTNPSPEAPKAINPAPSPA